MCRSPGIWHSQMLCGCYLLEADGGASRYNYWYSDGLQRSNTGAQNHSTSVWKHTAEGSPWWLREVQASKARYWGLIPSWGTKRPHVAWLNQKNLFFFFFNAADNRMEPNLETLFPWLQYLLLSLPLWRGVVGRYTRVSGCLLECMHMCPCVGVGVGYKRVNMETGGWGTV